MYRKMGKYTLEKTQQEKQPQNILPKQKLVMNVTDSKEHTELAKRFHLFYFTSGQFRNKSDCIAYLIETALDQIKEEEELMAAELLRKQKLRQQQQNKKQNEPISNTA